MESEHQSRTADGLWPLAARWLVVLAGCVLPLALAVAVSRAVGANAAQVRAPTAWINGVVCGPQYQPLPMDTHIRLYKLFPDGTCCEYKTLVVASAGAGDFAIPTEPLAPHLPGQFYLQAEAENMSPWQRSLPQPIYITSTTIPYNVPPIRLTYPSFEGVVFDPGGQPMMQTGDVNVLLPGQFHPVAWGEYSLGGLYQVGGVPDGVFHLMALPPMDSILWDSGIHTVTVAPDSQYILTATQSISLYLTLPTLTGWVYYPSPRNEPVRWITDTSGAIQGAAQVVIAPQGSSGNLWRFTAATGQFGFGAALATEYRVWALPTGTLAMTYTNSLPVTVFPPADTGVLTLTYPTVAGKVFDPQGVLLNGCATVALKDTNTGQAVATDDFCGQPGELFRLGGVPDGVYNLSAEAPISSGYAPPHPVQITVAHGSQYDPLQTQYRDLYLRSPQLTVHVTNGSQADVWLWDQTGAFQRQVITPPAVAVFDGLPIGQAFWLQAWPGGADIPALANSPRLAITIGADPQVFTLTLQAPNVIGVATDPAFAALPPVVDEPPYPAWVNVRAQNWSGELIAPTNNSGQFSLALPAGLYTLVARPNATNMIDLTQSLPVTFTLSAAHPFQNLGPIRLTYPSIRGRVRDPLGDAILTQVQGWSADGGYNQFSGSAMGPGGLFYQFGGMPNGWNYVQALPPEPNPLHYGPSSIHAFTVLPGSQYDDGATQAYTLTLTAANFIGKLQYPPSYSACPLCPVAGVDVRLHEANWLYTAWAYSDANGEFTFTGLNPGTYILEFFLPAPLQLDWNAPVGPGNTFVLTTITDTLSRIYELQPAVLTKWMSGTVMLQGDGPVSDARVVAYHLASGQWKTADVDMDGVYGMPLGPGLWYAWVQPYSAAPAWYFSQSWGQWVQFSPDAATPETRYVDFTVIPALYYTVDGTVLDAGLNPPPLNSTMVHLCRDEGGCFSATADAGGHFAVAVLPGSYQVWVQVQPGAGLLPPLNNGAAINVSGNRTLPPIILRPAASRVAQVNGRVINIATGLGMSSVTIQAWSDAGDWVTTTTSAGGYYSLALTPGDWHATLLINQAQEQDWYVLPPQVRDGRLEAGQIVNEVNFMVRYRDSTLQGLVTDEMGNPITGTVAMAYALACAPMDCWLVDADRVMGGRFNLRVPGNVTYTVNVWLPGNDYFPGQAAVVPVGIGQTVTDLHLTLQTAATRIRGILLDPASGAVQIRAAVFAAQGSQWVEDSLWPGRDPYEFSLRVPTPLDDSHWKLGLWVDPSSGYVAEPSTPLYDVLLTPGMTETQPVTLYVRRLNASITGVVTLEGAPASQVVVYARGRPDSSEWGLSFEGVTGPDGTFTLSVPLGSYWVGAYVPAELSALYFAPSPAAWNGTSSGPLSLAFIPRGAAMISGSLAVTPTASISPTAILRIFGTSPLGHVEVTGTLAGGYHLPVAPNTRWTVWAAYEDPAADRYYRSPQITVDVLGGTLSGVDLTLSAAEDALPDTLCWSFDASRFMRLDLPAASNRPAAVITIPAGAFPVNGRVTVCARPRLALPGGEALLGFAYDLEARDSQGRLITQEFNRPVRISFFVDPDQLPIDANTHSLQVVFYSAGRQAWVPLQDLYFDPATGLVSGTTRHFTKFGVRGSFGGEVYRLYLPLIGRESPAR